MTYTTRYVDQQTRAGAIFVEQMQRIAKLMATSGYEVECRPALSKKERKLAHTAALNKLRGGWESK